MPASVLRYPYEAITETTDYFQITIKKYDPADIVATPAYGAFTNVQNVSSNNSGNPNPAQLVDGGIIILPMPANITDRKEVGYGPDSLDAVSATAAQALTTGVEGFGEALSAAASGSWDTARTKAGTTTAAIVDQFKTGGRINELGEQVVKNLTAEAANLIPGVNVTARQLLTRSTGKILNPNMELLFDGPSLRSFGFQFKMTPRDRTESNQVKSIIRTLKKNMSPRIAGTGTFLSTPNVFEIAYRKGGNNHPFLHKFKQCALKDLSINYTGENVYATYDDGTPVSLTMTVSFQELVPIYDKDYNDRASDGSYTDNFDQSQLQYSANGKTEGVGY